MTVPQNSVKDFNNRLKAVHTFLRKIIVLEFPDSFTESMDILPINLTLVESVVFQTPFSEADYILLCDRKL